MEISDMKLPIDSIKITVTSEGQLTLGYAVNDRVIINRVMHVNTGESIVIETPGFELPVSVSIP